MTRKKLFRKIRKTLRNPYTYLVFGCILIFCGVLDEVEIVITDIFRCRIDDGHGVIFFGLTQVFIAFLHIIDGIGDIALAEVEKAVEEPSSSIENTTN